LSWRWSGIRKRRKISTAEINRIFATGPRFLRND
jgi:hypothetical protein